MASPPTVDFAAFSSPFRVTTRPVRSTSLGTSRTSSTRTARRSSRTRARRTKQKGRLEGCRSHCLRNPRADIQEPSHRGPLDGGPGQAARFRRFPRWAAPDAQMFEQCWDRMYPALSEPEEDESEEDAEDRKRDDMEKRAGPFHWLDEADRGRASPTPFAWCRCSSARKRPSAGRTGASPWTARACRRKSSSRPCRQPRPSAARTTSKTLPRHATS